MSFISHLNTTNEDALTGLLLQSQGVSFETLLDVMRVGIVLQAVSATIAGMVVLNYYLRCKGDPWSLKVLILFMFAAVITQMSLANAEWAALLHHRNFYETLYNEDLTHANLLFLFTFIVTVCSQAFFGFRAYALHSRKLWVALTVGFLVLANFSVSVATTQYGLRFPRSSPNIPKLGLVTYHNGMRMKAISEALSLITLITDLYITSLIIFALMSSKTGWSKTNSLVTRLIVVITESMLPPVLCQIVMTITIWAGVGIGGFLKALHMIEAPLYLWAVAFSLSSRDSVKRAMQSDPLTTKISSISGGREGGTARGGGRYPSTYNQGGIISKIMGGGDNEDLEGGDYLVMNNLSSNTLPQSERSTNGVRVTVDKYSDQASQV